jgi:hypothetical protein
MSDDTLSSVHLLKIYEYCGLNVTTPRLMLILKNSKRHPPPEIRKWKEYKLQSYNVSNGKLSISERTLKMRPLRKLQGILPDL